MSEQAMVNLMTEDELCEWLGKSKAWAQRGRWAGYGPKYVKVGRAVRYRESDVLEWLDAHIRQSTSDPGDAA